MSRPIVARFRVSVSRTVPFVADQRGFSLFEMLLALGVLALLAGPLMSALAGLQASQQRMTTEARLRTLAAAIERTYRLQAWTIDQQAGAVLATGTANLVDGPATAAAFADVLRAGAAPTDLVDGFNRPWQVRVSTRLVRLRNGVAVPFHVIALISNQGGDYVGAAPAVADPDNPVVVGQVLDAGTAFDAATGALTLGGIDAGIVVSGWPVWEGMAIEAEHRLARVAEAYAGWYQTRFLSSSGAPATDFFATRGNDTWWDSTNAGTAVVASCDVLSPDNLWGNPLTQLSLDQVLGLGANALTPWGQVLRAVNCGAPARSPASGAGLTQPPYTAVLAALLPNGARIEHVVTGRQ